MPGSDRKNKRTREESPGNMLREPVSWKLEIGWESPRDLLMSILHMTYTPCGLAKGLIEQVV